MNDVTEVLVSIEQGDPTAADRLLPLVYDELKRLAAAKLAKEPSGVTLQPTALVHEAYLRLVKADNSRTWDSRGHFFAAAAESMRRILVERARRKLRAKYGGEYKRIELTDIASGEMGLHRLLAVHEALDKLAAEDEVKAKLVKLRCFAGMSLEDAGLALGISRATASRYWSYAKTWLYCELEDAGHL